MQVWFFFERNWRHTAVAVSKEFVMTGSENGVYGVRVLGYFKAKVGERVGTKCF